MSIRTTTRKSSADLLAEAKELAATLPQGVKPTREMTAIASAISRKQAKAARYAAVGR